MLPIEIERLTDDIRREVEARGAELVDIQFRRIGGRGCLTVLADKTGGISLDECVAINRSLGAFLDSLSEASPEGSAALRGAYFLEVNSPGLDRPLKTERDLARAVGEDLRVVWREPDGRTLELRGRLEGVSGGVLRLGRADGTSSDVSLETVVKAVREVKI